MSMSLGTSCNVNVVGKLVNTNEKSKHIQFSNNHKQFSNVGPSREQEFFNSTDNVLLNGNIPKQMAQQPFQFPSMNGGFQKAVSSENSKWASEFAQDLETNSFTNPTSNYQVYSESTQLHNNNGYNSQFQDMSQTYTTNSFRGAQITNVMSSMRDSLPRSAYNTNMEAEFEELERELADLDMDSIGKPLAGNETPNTNMHELNEDQMEFKNIASDIYDLSKAGELATSSSKLVDSKFMKLMKLIGDGSVNLQQNNNELCSADTGEVIGNKYLYIRDQKELN